MSSERRRTIDIQLIDLVKPHVLLYDGKTTKNKYQAQDRQIIWERICTELNEKFGLERGK